GVLSFAGAVDMSGLTVFHEALAEEPVKNLGFRGTVRGSYALDKRLLNLDEAKLSFRGVDASLEAEAALAGGLADTGLPRAERRLKAHLAVAPVACQVALNALPREITPRLQGFKLKGNFSADVHVDIDWANLDALDLGGQVGIWGCKVLDAPPDMKK